MILGTATNLDYHFMRTFYISNTKYITNSGDRNLDPQDRPSSAGWKYRYSVHNNQWYELSTGGAKLLDGPPKY